MLLFNQWINLLLCGKSAIRFSNHLENADLHLDPIIPFPIRGLQILIPTTPTLIVDSVTSTKPLMDLDHSTPCLQHVRGYVEQCEIR